MKFNNDVTDNTLKYLPELMRYTYLISKVMDMYISGYTYLEILNTTGLSEFDVWYIVEKHKETWGDKSKFKEFIEKYEKTSKEGSQ